MSPSTNGQRPGEELRLSNEARKLKAEMDRAQQRAEKAQEEAAAARGELLQLHKHACEKFGREVPPDAMLLDVLASIVIEPGDVWRWLGTRNNKNLATIRMRAHQNAEVSLVRYLAVEFGVISDDDYGILYPTGDPDDVNPWHRTLRRTSYPVGNINRYAFAVPKNDTTERSVG